MARRCMQLAYLVQRSMSIFMTLLGRLTQRWEASLWLSGKQLYLGGFESEEDAARAYDIAALASKGLDVPTNFGLASYQAELQQLKDASKVGAAADQGSIRLPALIRHVC